MRHPFDGVIVSLAQPETTPTRRSVLGKLLAAAAGVGAFLAGSRASAQIATTLALGEEGGTTARRGEEAGRLPPITTFALGEEGRRPPRVTTFALGEEGTVTTQALGEEGGPIFTTQALGEEGNPPITTQALGEEGGPIYTTQALGEEGGRNR